MDIEVLLERIKSWQPSEEEIKKAGFRFAKYEVEQKEKERLARIANKMFSEFRYNL